MTASVPLAEFRARPGRFVAVLLAIAVGVGFAVGTEVLTSSYAQAFDRAAAAEVSRIDLVVTSTGDELDLAGIARVAGVRTVEPAESDNLLTAGPGSRGYLQVSNIPLDPAARWYTLRSGRWPAGPHEMAVDGNTATRTHLTVGSVVLVAPHGSVTPSVRVSVTAILDTTVSPVAGATDAAYGSLALLDSLGVGPPLAAQVTTAPGFSADQVAAAIVGELGGAVTAATAAAITQQRIVQFAGNDQLVNLLLSGFLALAALVATMVVATTFTIVLTGRRRQLALLRCVGATTGQVRRTILVEAAVLGAAGAVLGVAAGIVGGRLAAHLAGITGADIRVDVVGVAVIGLLGALATVLAAWVPITRAIRIPPVAAISPVESDARLRRVGWLQTAVGALLLGGGGALMAAGVVMVSLPAAIAGGGLTAIGVVLSLRGVVPLLAGAAGWLAGRLAGGRGAVGRIAVANIRRHPGRSASSCAVLVICVGAVVTLLVAAASAQAGADRAAVQRNPLDLTLSVTDGAVPPSLLGSITSIHGVRAATAVRGSTVTIDGEQLTGYGPTAEQLDQVVSADHVGPGQIALPAYLVSELNLSAGDPITVTRGARTVRLAVAGHAVTADGSVVMPAPDLLRLDPAPALTAVWARFDPSADPNEVIGAVNPVVAPMTTVTLAGSGADRAATEQTLTSLIRIALGLLAFTVLIALIGIGNTLSLSVVERARESALLRALGLRRRQLRWMLGWEAALLALVAAVVGTVFGLLFGWVAVATTFGTAGRETVISVPWGRVGLVVAGTLAAGVLASVLPGRRSARATPVQALAQL